MPTATATDLLLLLQRAAAARDPDVRADTLDEAMRSGLPAAASDVVALAHTAEQRAAVLMWMRLFPGAADLAFIAACQAAETPAVRAAAASALQLVPLDAAAGRYQQALRDPDVSVRVRAVRTLGERREPAASPLLTGALADPDEGVRSWATWALERCQ